MASDSREFEAFFMAGPARSVGLRQAITAQAARRQATHRHAAHRQAAHLKSFKDAPQAPR